MFKVIKSNISKAKTSMVTLVILLFLASLLLNIGLTVAMSISSFFTDKVKQLNAPDIIYYLGGFSSIQEPDSFMDNIQNQDGILKIEIENSILSTGVIIQKGEINISNSFLFVNGNEDEKLSDLIIIDKSDKLTDDSIVLPLSFRDSYGYKTDETITMTVNSMEKKYIIYGFFEDIFFGPSTVTLTKTYLAEKAYQELSDQLPAVNSNGKLLSIISDNTTSLDNIFDGISKAINDIRMDGFIYGLTLDTAKTNDFMFVNILVMIMIGFSFIMVIVSLIVIAFSIISGIEDGIRNIGVLKALGYKNSQVILTFILQYGGLAGIGGLLGVTGSLLLMGSIGRIAAESSGLLWELSGNVVSVLVSFFAILLLVVLITFLCAVRIKRITPIIALRNGFETHNFKRNHLPLSRSRVNVNLSITIKTILQGFKQNVMICIIVAALTFASVFSILMYKNMVEDKTALLNIIGVPISDMWFMINDRTVDFDRYFQEIQAMEEVESTVKYEQIPITLLNTQNVNLVVTNDFNKLPRMTVTEGRYPIHDNEISISKLILKKAGKEVGDTVSISMWGNTAEYLICGATEQAADNGLSADMTQSGMQKLIPDYKVNGIIIGLNDHSTTKEFTSVLESRYKDISWGSLDIKATLENITRSFEGGVTILMLVVLLIMVMVVTLILFLIIKMKILRERTNIGIFKATGFTTLQLMNQIALSFTTVVLTGTIIGAVLGGLYSNKFVALLLSGMGVSNVNFTMSYLYILYLIIAITLVAFIVSNLVAFRIRKITAYSLLTE